jgi:predicted DNA-binding transcriptional regulator YafY
MAKESFDKEIQFMRMLVLTSGAYNRQQFAERLGISVHTLDKTLKRLKGILGEDGELAEMMRYSYLDSSEPMLLFLFRAKSLKESESQRLSLLLTTLDVAPLTALELLDACCASQPPEAAQPDEKTIRNDLKYLEQVGVVCKESGPRPYRYRLCNDLVRHLSEDELLDLYDYVDMMASTQVPSVQGYLLRDSLGKQLNRSLGADHEAAVFHYKYHYYSRILDEAHLFPLFAAIRQRRQVRFLYYSPKRRTSYTSKNTNPLFERDSEGKHELTLPLRIVYDHQYGRWYLIGCNARTGIRKYRIEGITHLEEGQQDTEERYQSQLAELDRRTQYSWLIDTGEPVQVKVRFFHPGPGIPNFVKERVLLQGQWGSVTEENAESFIYEITVNGTLEIKPWLRSFGSSCEVLAPLKLREELIEEWKEIGGYYESV